MADKIDPTSNEGKISNFLPNFYRTDANKKFLHATVEQLTQTGTVKTINGYIGRQNAKATKADDIFIEAPSKDRQNYQLEPSIIIKDTLDNTTFFKDYQDYINQINVFGGNTKNHARVNKEEFYSWDPHIDWDKFTNFQNYYWLPYGPEVITIFGQPKGVELEFIVTVESQLGNNAYIFTPKRKPEGFDRNPTIKLYRGMTYRFDINSPGNPFSIKTTRTSGPLDRYSISGITAQGVEKGEIVFSVPFNSPDVLFYVSEFDVDLGGVFQIESIVENSYINVDNSIIGKKSYVLANGTRLSNGMRIEFIGDVYPEYYINKQFYVEGVGSGISLVYEKDLELISSYTESISVLFDTTPFDNLPFSDATSYPRVPDYITINRASRDHNPWTRYNRWFHKDVIEASAAYNGKVAEIDQSARAVRPIIEFDANLKLFNFGTDAIQDVDLVDTFTTDVFSTIEGSLGYNIDGIPVTQGHRILFAADTDTYVANKIFRAEFIRVQTSSREIPFTPLTDVNVTSNVITFSERHRLSTRNAVLYNSNGNNAIDGMSSLQTYYIKDIDGYSLTLFQDEQLTKKVDIISVVDKGKVYTFSLEDIVGNPGILIPYSVYETDIDSISNQITFTTPHGYENGTEVRYRETNNNSFPGPVNNATYYVSVINEYTIVLYEEYNGLEFARPVNIVINPIIRPHLLVTYETNRQIHLVEEVDPVKNNVVLVRQGIKNQGKMFWFDGNSWMLAQQKLTTNQHPAFDIVDNNGNSLGDTETYPGSTFIGTNVFSYKIGTGSADPNLNFPLSYKNIENIGDIVFNFNLATDTFKYNNNTKIITNNINTGYLIKSESIDAQYYVNGWQKCTAKNTQAAIRIYKNQTNNFNIDFYDDNSNLDDLEIKVYINGKRLEKIGNNTPILTTQLPEYLVTFSYAYRPIPPAPESECTVDSNRNPAYEGKFKVVSGTNYQVVLSYPSDPGEYLTDDTFLQFGSNTNIVPALNVENLKKVKFTIPKQEIAPLIGSYYKVVSNNWNYDGEFKVVDSSITSIVLEYKSSPGEFILGATTLTLLNWTVVSGLHYKTILLTSDISAADILTVKSYARQPINDKAYYEIPVNLQNNPLNEVINEFTLGEVIDHVNSIVDNVENFIGVYPGTNNIRDLGNITQYGTKFIQHSGPASLSLYHITSQQNNIVRAIEKSRDDYVKFKKVFLTFAETIGIDDPILAVDEILFKISKDIPRTYPYYFSDMVPFGASIKTELPVVDYRIKSYPLTSTFNLSEVTEKAVLIYHHNKKTKVITQLLYEHEYTFDDQGFVIINAPMNDDDTIVIYEFESTNGSFVPPTPTKLGLWPKYDPKIYEDTTLITPRTMIQGHDGSLILAYGDYRDDLILELEKRIYNNIKVNYDPTIFDYAEVIPGYSRTTDYSLDEFNQILAPSFYKWTTLIDRDFTKPFSYDESNPLTFNYKDHNAPDGRSVPGYWRGIYRWMLDTDRPNIAPWEMLGFSDEPLWWNEVYGPAPYTSDNFKLWQDLRDGAIREPGKPAVVMTQYVRPFLFDHIPVDNQGNILSPISSGLTSGIITQSTEGDFVFGDVSPIEAAWRRGSSYPFSVLIAATLMYPAKVLGTLLDRSRIKRNLADQIIYTDTGTFIRPIDVNLPCIYAIPSTRKTAGIINYVTDYILSDNLKSYKQYAYDLHNLKSRLSYRIGSFTSKDKFNLLLDSKTPLSSGSVFVPQEDFEIILNSSSPIKKITYSAVIVSKVSDGFDIKGYSQTQPYFYYYPWIDQGNYINVGGISESFVNWAPNTRYDVGKIVEYASRYYRSTSLHTSSEEFSLDNFVPLPTLPVVGGRNAYFRSMWDRAEPIAVPYGTKFSTIQEVVDFLLGYGEWLKDQGFVFDEFNPRLNAVTNWETSAKEFMFWTTQNWSSGQDKWQEWKANNETAYGDIVRYNGDYYRAIRNSEASPIFIEEDFVMLDGLSTIGSSVLSLSPAAAKITFSIPLSVVDDIRNPFYVYEILKVDGTPIEPKFINSYRNNTEVSYSPKSEDGIYGATFYLIQKEQVVLLNNSTIFNDTIYSPSTGYRQERIKVFGYVGSEWSGAFDVPGFIFDQAQISEWDAWTDYNLGDIVKYKQYYYSAKYFISGDETFKDTDWVKLDKEPKPQLLPNWSYKAAQFTDFYDLDSDNFDLDQQIMAQHLIGYQRRQYLSNIIKNNVSEYKFYQGMIIEKGTKNVFNKLFDVLSSEGQESLTFYEEWALRVGQYGANLAFENIEFVLDEGAFKTNAQAFELTNESNPERTDYIIQITPNDLYVKPKNYKSNPWPTLSNFRNYLRTPGYVRPNEVKLIVKSITDLFFLNEWNPTVYYTINDTVTYNGVNYISKTENVLSIPSDVSDDWLIFNISSLHTGDYIWCGFEGREWNVYQYVNANLKVNDVVSSEGNLEIVFDKLAIFKINDIIGIDNVTGFNGFYKVLDVRLDTVVLDSLITFSGEFSEQSKIQVYKLVPSRFNSLDELASNPIISKTGNLLWTDNLGDGRSATWEYNPVYDINNLVNQYPVESLKFGKSLAIDNNSNIAAIVDSTGNITTYIKQEYTTAWVNYQEITPPFFKKYTPFMKPEFDIIGDAIAMSDDSKWLAVGSPKASNVCSRYVGDWSLNDAYVVGDIVRSGFKFYKALFDYESRTSVVTGSITGTTLTTIYNGLESELLYVGQTVYGIGVTSGTKVIAIGSSGIGIKNYIVNISQTVLSTTIVANDPPPALNKIVWEELDYVPVDRNGVNSTRDKEGVITIYEKDATNTFILVDTFLSPQPIDEGQFGLSLSFADNSLFVGSTNAVYQLSYGDITKAKARYISSGSDGTTVKLSSTEGINPGMAIKGNGFSSGQIVEEVYDLTQTILISSLPDSDPYGDLEFTIKSWAYGYNTVISTVTEYDNLSLTITVDDVTGIEPGALVSGFGFYSGQIIDSIDTDNQLMLNFVPDINPIPGTELSFTMLNRFQPIGEDTEFGYSIEVSKDFSTLLISSPDVTKVYVYKFVAGLYTLLQVIEDQTLELSDQDTRFGESISVSNNGTYIAIASKLSDVEELDQGKVQVYAFETDQYNIYQVLTDITPERTGLFGSKVSFMNDFNTLVVYSQNAETYTETTFDNFSTIFDDGTTIFAKCNVNTGRIDIYDRYNSYWIYSESLKNDLDMVDGYGTAIAVGNNTVLVSAVYADDKSLESGIVYEYSKIENTHSWKIIHRETNKIDVKKVKQAFLYNKITNKLVTYLDVIDPVQGKIPGIADQEIKFKTFFDPATYSIGTDSVRVDDGMAWTADHVGMLWWDLRTCKFFDSYSDDIIYRNSSWNTLFPGASVDIYEWVETSLLPSEWNELSDTEEGLTLNISGRPLYDDNVYSVVKTYDNVSQSLRNTYYYWVKNKKTIPDVMNRRMSAQDVSSLISNPRGSGHKYLVLNSNNTFSLANVQTLLEDKDIILSVEYWTVDNIEQNIHTQWSLISNDINSNIPQIIEQKWVDSLCGKDLNDREVPDYTLPIKLRYGIENRPRQSMFVNRFEVLKQVIEQANRSLALYQITDQKNISKLDSYDPEPSIISSLYDIILDTDAELRFSGSGSFKKATLSPVFVDGKIVDVVITDSGKGYGCLYPKTYDVKGVAIEWYGPDVNILGSGVDAKIKTVINVQGQVIDTVIVSAGYGYNDNTVLLLRNYAVLVHSDSKADNQWSIYTYEPLTRLWSRTLTQSYDVRKYWSYKDWFDPNTDYNETTSYNYIIETFVDLNTITTNIGDLIKVKTTNSSNWVLLEKYADTVSNDWTQQYKIVGSQNGTIEFSSLLYQFADTAYGYDGTLYDASIFDDVASKELRIILDALKNDIFIDTLKQDYLDLFFTSIRYALSEQTHLDWTFKTSFIKARHNVGELKEKVTYNNDSLSDFEAYVSEVKPYRTKVREYVSSYNKIDSSQSSITDFDLPSVYDDSVKSKIKTRPISINLINDVVQTTDAEIVMYPWKHWSDNVGFTVLELRIVDGGLGYISEPVVRFNSDSGSGAHARAFIANGRVNRIVLLNPGKGYLSAPKIVIDGGLSTTGRAASAVAIIGNGVIRTNMIKMKFDRITQTYFITQLQESESFVGTGSRTQFTLKWGPDIRVGFSNVTINGIEVLRDDYKLSIIKSITKGHTSYTGSIIFKIAPANLSKINITYLKDWSLLNAADRIQYYYNPNSGELGKDLSQLMTGVDYGGVIVTGLNFDTNNGWDSLPFYTNKWDDFEYSTEDYSTLADQNQHSFTFPDFFPIVEGTEINIYYAESSQSSVIRIDDIDYDGTPIAEKPNVVMATWISDGISRTIEIPETFEVAQDSTFIFRKSTSDGSIKPKDDSYDTALSGGDLAYSTATGLAAEDIILDGDGFVTPTSSPATEEVVPGQVVDTLAIKVFEKSMSGSAAMKVDSYYADGITTDFAITQQPNSSEAVIVKFTENYFNPATNLMTTKSTIKLIDTDFVVDYRNRLIKFVEAPAEGKLISIFSIGFNGENISDIGYFVGNGSRVNFETNAPWTTSIRPLIYVDGQPAPSNVGLINSGLSNRVTIKFAVPPTDGALISYIIVLGTEQTYSITQSEHFAGNGTATYQLQNRVGNTELNESNMIVRVGQQILNGPKNSYFKISNNRLNYTIDATNIPPFSVSVDDIIVLVEGTILTQLVDYTVDLKGITIKISRSVYNLYSGKTLVVSCKDGSGYLYYDDPIYRTTTMYASRISGTRLVLGSVANGPVVVGMILSGSGVQPGTRIVSGTGMDWRVNVSQNVNLTIITGQIQTGEVNPMIVFDKPYDSTNLIEVISSYKHDILDIESTLVDMSIKTKFTPDTLKFYEQLSVLGGRIPLARPVINDSYVWIMKNGSLLTPSVDYKLDDDYQTVILAEQPDNSDLFRIMTFSNEILGSNISYMQFKDMLNRVHYKRLNANKRTQLTRELLSTDLTIEVEDASTFDLPNPVLNRPGIIEIRGERIEYFKLEGNTLSQLRRGTLGTGTPNRHDVGAYVQDIGVSETIPYVDDVRIDQIVSTGSQFIELDFVPTKSNNNETWFTDFGYRLKGNYDNSISYVINDVVIYNQQYYVNISASKDILPTNTSKWQLLSAITTDYGQADDIEVFVGGYDISMEWEPNSDYNANDIVIIGSYTYRTSSKIRTGENFISPVSVLNEDGDVVSENVTYSAVWNFFIGNIRLKKYPYYVHNINKSPESTAGDIRFDPDFTVDGVTNQIRLTNVLQPGVRITVIRKHGLSWDAFGSVQENNSKISNFIKSVPGAEYKDIVNYELIVPITFGSTVDTYDETDKNFE